MPQQICWFLHSSTSCIRTSMNVLWIRNCSTYSEPITSNMTSGKLADAAAYAAVRGGQRSWPPSWKYDIISEICLINRCIFTWRSILPNFILIWFEMTEHWAFLSALPQQEGKISRDTRSVPDPKCTFLISILSTLFNTNNNKVFSELWPLLLYLLHNRICLNNSKDVPPSQNNESVAANMFNCFIKTTIFNNICQKNTLWRQNHYRNMHGLC